MAEPTVPCVPVISTDCKVIAEFAEARKKPAMTELPASAFVAIPLSSELL